MVEVEYSSQAVDFPSHFLTPYSHSEYYKLRAGDYRIVVDWQRSNDDEDTLVIRRIGHRDGFYD